MPILALRCGHVLVAAVEQYVYAKESDMRPAAEVIRKPHGDKHFVFHPGAPEGACWKAVDGTVVRIATAHGQARAREPENCDASLRDIAMRFRLAGALSIEWRQRRDVAWLWRVCIWTRRVWLIVHLVKWLF